jgi:hypothetical protein
MAQLITLNNIDTTAITAISGPRISGILYPGNDTAAAVAGGQTVSLTGTGFQTGLAVYVNGTVVSVASVISVTLVTFAAPAQAAGSYTLHVVNPDGGTATFVPGIQYSGVPAWSTTAGSLGTADSGTAFSSNLAATSDSTVTYSVVSGTLPSGVTLNSTTGVISGTLPSVSSSTTYNFTIAATDGENQDTDRAFSITVNSGLPPGQQAFTTIGATSWTVPAGVTSIAAVLIGPGSSQEYGGGGGGLRYINDLPVTPGETLEVYVGWSDFMGGSRNTYIKRGSNTLIYASGPAGYSQLGGTGIALGAGPFGGTIGGGNGGVAGSFVNSSTPNQSVGSGGGGAGGYSGNGGNGGGSTSAPTAGAGGGGGGGGKGSSNPGGGGGGGTGLFGEGTSGAAGSNGYNATGGGGGSSGGAGETSGYNDGANGGLYGGGGGGGSQNAQYTVYYSGQPAQGAARIIWGPGRSFPATNTADQ